MNKYLTIITKFNNKEITNIAITLFIPLSFTLFNWIFNEDYFDIASSCILTPLITSLSVTSNDYIWCSTSNFFLIGWILFFNCLSQIYSGSNIIEAILDLSQREILNDPLDFFAPYLASIGFGFILGKCTEVFKLSFKNKNAK